jgi:FkbM family methyltransferase
LARLRNAAGRFTRPVRRHFPAFRRLRAFAAQLDPPFELADVGARFGPHDRWVLLAPPVRIVGFEPDKAECDRLTRRARSEAVRYVPIALGARPGPATLYVTAELYCSSLYPPDPDVVAAHPELAVSALVGEQTVELETLDGWCERTGIGFDALKLDVQGAELDVLKGAAGQLDRVVGLEVEVEFNPLYRGQPLFGEVDRFLRARGFELYRLGNLMHYARRGAPDDSAQVFYGHAHYFAADVLAERADRGRARRAGIAAAGFGFPALAATLTTA